jgi:hypothetical protein
MVVADDHRPPRADVVDVTLAFDVPQVGAVRALREERLAADGLERTGELTPPGMRARARWKRS